MSAIDDFPLPPPTTIPLDHVRTSTRYYPESTMREHRKAYAAHVAASVDVDALAKEAKRLTRAYSHAMTAWQCEEFPPRAAIFCEEAASAWKTVCTAIDRIAAAARQAPAPQPATSGVRVARTVDEREDGVTLMPFTAAHDSSHWLHISHPAGNTNVPIRQPRDHALWELLNAIADGEPTPTAQPLQAAGVEARRIAELVVTAIENAYNNTEQSVPRDFCGEATDAAYGAVMDALATPPAPEQAAQPVAESIVLDIAGEMDSYDFRDVVACVRAALAAKGAQE